MSCESAKSLLLQQRQQPQQLQMDDNKSGNYLVLLDIKLTKGLGFFVETALFSVKDFGTFQE